MEGSLIIDDELKQLRERCDGATEGPWRVGPLEGGFRLIEDRSGYRFAQVDDGGNREFIAAARTALPQLLEFVGDLQDENEELRINHEQHCEYRRQLSKPGEYEAELQRIQEERDEARAEVERLRKQIRTVPHVGHLCRDEQGNPAVDKYDPCCPACWLGLEFP